MPIRDRLVEVAKAKKVKASSSTHSGNGDNVDIEEQSLVDLENNMDVDQLIDPEEAPGGDTHFSITAKRKIKADPTLEQNIGTLDHDIEPAKGYIENASEGDADFEENMDFDLDEEEVEATFNEELENNEDVTPIEVNSEDADWDSEPPKEYGDDDIEEEEDDEGIDEATPEFNEPEEQVTSGEEMSLMDLDEIDDSDNKDVHFATAGTRVLVIKGNRIIASMTERVATKAGRLDVYLSDQFAEVTASEIAKRGLRNGLKTMGYIAAKVKVGSSTEVKALVARQVTKTTAAVRQVAATNQKAMEQSLAIAAVGINRGFFDKKENVLRASLEQALINAGMRNPKRLLNPVFASVGPEYAKQVMTLAQKISAMPQDVRDGYVSALDMTSEDLDEPDEDMVPIGADEDEDEFDDVEPGPTMATAGVARRQKVQAGTYSLTASAILNGDQQLFML